MLVALVLLAGWLLLIQLAIRPMTTDLTVIGQGKPALVLAHENYSPAGAEASPSAGPVKGSCGTRADSSKMAAANAA